MYSFILQPLQSTFPFKALVHLHQSRTKLSNQSNNNPSIIIISDCKRKKQVEANVLYSGGLCWLGRNYSSLFGFVVY
jgi:hypothetical protein